MMNRIRSELESMGVSVWTDEGLIPGTESWTKTIESKIRDALGVVVILSPSANRSEWVGRELGYASGSFGMRVAISGTLIFDELGDGCKHRNRQGHACVACCVDDEQHVCRPIQKV